MRRPPSGRGKSWKPARFSASTIARRAGNKLALQKQFNLPQDAEIPLIGMVQRLDDQKGIDILVEAIDTILAEKTQLVIVGRGRERITHTSPWSGC